MQRYEFIAPYNSFAAKDGWVVFGIGGKRFGCVSAKPSVWEALIDDPEFLTNKDRVTNVQRLESIVTDWTSRRQLNDIVSLLMDASVPCAPILNIDQICADPHIAEAREMIVEMDHPLEGRMKVISCPIKFTNKKPSIRSTAPLHGEHTEQVLSEILGISKEVYARLKHTGAVG